MGWMTKKYKKGGKNQVSWQQSLGGVACSGFCQAGGRSKKHATWDLPRGKQIPTLKQGSTWERGDPGPYSFQGDADQGPTERFFGDPSRSFKGAGFVNCGNTNRGRSWFSGAVETFPVEWGTKKRGALSGVEIEPQVGGGGTPSEAREGAGLWKVQQKK